MAEIGVIETEDAAEPETDGLVTETGDAETADSEKRIWPQTQRPQNQRTYMAETAW